MKKLFLLLPVILLLFIFSGCEKKTTNIIEETPLVQDEECSLLCEQIKGTCPSLVMVNNCEESCLSWDDDFREEVSQSSSCQEIMEKNEIIEMLIPEINEPELKEATNDCEAACNKYVIACLTLVPNASASLFDEGYESCLGECQKWNPNKVDCMINAFDCEAMTDVCGL